MLLAVPNVSEGRDERVIATIARAFAGGGGGVRVLDVHSDADHHRSVFTLAGAPGELSAAVLAGARAAVELVDVVGRGVEGGGASLARAESTGQHPYVGAVDVAPIVYLEPGARGAACAEALVVADRIGAELGVPVFLYGELVDGDPRATRARLRRGGVRGLAGRMTARDPGGAVRPDFGPPRMHASAGATLVAARAPLVAFNVQLGPGATVADASAIAALIREGGAEGLPGLRAIGVRLSGERAQVSMNVERPLEVPLALIVEAIARHGPVASGELVGLAPQAALEGFPEDVPLQGFDAARQLLEKALG